MTKRKNPSRRLPVEWTEADLVSLVSDHQRGVTIKDIAAKLQRPIGSVSGKIWAFQRKSILASRYDVGDRWIA